MDETTPLVEAELTIRRELDASSGGAMERLFAEYARRDEGGKEAFVAALIGRVVVSDARRAFSRTPAA